MPKFIKKPIPIWLDVASRLREVMAEFDIPNKPEFLQTLHEWWDENRNIKKSKTDASEE